MSKFNSVRDEWPRPHVLPGGRVMHENGVTVLPPPKDDEDAEKERAPVVQTPVLFFPTH